MTELDDRDCRIAALKERLARLSEAGISISGSLDPDAVLQNVLDSARHLTGAQYGVMTTLDESGGLEDFMASGLATEEAQRLWTMPGGTDFYEYLRTIPGPMRVGGFAGHAMAMGLPDFEPPTPMSSFLTVPITWRGENIGNIHIVKHTHREEGSRAGVQRGGRGDADDVCGAGGHRGVERAEVSGGAAGEGFAGDAGGHLAGGGGSV